MPSHYALASPGSTVNVVRSNVYPRSSIGPSSYTPGTGLVVDLSNEFDSIDSVLFARSYTTASKAAEPRIWKIHETGADVLNNRRFRLLCFVGATPQGTNLSTGNTTNGNAITATGTLALRNATETGAAAVCGALQCTGTHPNSVVAQRSNILEAPGAVKTSVVTGVGNQQFTGMVETQLAELSAGVNLSSISVEYWVIGVPV